MRISLSVIITPHFSMGYINAFRLVLVLCSRGVQDHAYPARVHSFFPPVRVIEIVGEPAICGSYLFSFSSEVFLQYDILKQAHVIAL